MAILFLTKGDLFHHAVWRLWFQSAAGVLPRAPAHAAACAPGAAPGGDARTLCALQALAGPGAGDDDAAVIDAQHLFSVYVHAPPGVQDSSLPPLFQGRLVSRRIDAAWGSHGLVEAARNLLWEAYKEPTNQRFMLVSESDIPLYDPMTMYQQVGVPGGRWGGAVVECGHMGIGNCAPASHLGGMGPQRTPVLDVNLLDSGVVRGTNAQSQASCPRQYTLSPPSAPLTFQCLAALPCPPCSLSAKRAHASMAAPTAAQTEDAGRGG